jgi:hypothetical protein
LLIAALPFFTRWEHLLSAASSFLHLDANSLNAVFLFLIWWHTHQLPLPPFLIFPEQLLIALPPWFNSFAIILDCCCAAISHSADTLVALPGRHFYIVVVAVINCCSTYSRFVGACVNCSTAIVELQCRPFSIWPSPSLIATQNLLTRLTHS